MKLRKSIFYVIPILVFFALDELFIPFPYGVNAGPNAYREVILLLGKLLPFAALVYVALNILKQRPFLVFMFSLPLVYFVYLVFESLYLYGSFFEFPHVGLKIMDLVVTIAIFIFYKDRQESTPFGLIMNVILLALVVKIALNPSMVSATAFVGHDRGVPSPSAYLLLLPCLYFFNIYIVELKQWALIKFLIFLAFIIFFQHRTVWVATAGALLFNVILLQRQNKIKLEKAIPGIIPLGFIILFAAAVVLTYLPGMVDKIGDNIENILNPDTEGSTSSWRIEQFRSYLPFIAEYPLEGMRLQGFELPIQFYNPNTAEVQWQEGTGHHFHSFYFDKLFYFGLIGMLIFMFYILRSVSLAIRRNITFDYRQFCFLSFAFSGLIYGLGYDFPTHYFAILGLALATVEKENFKNETLNVS